MKKSSFERSLTRPNLPPTLHGNFVADSQHGPRFVQVQVSALTSDPFNDMPIVVLRDANDSVTLPIRIGLGEACAIAAELDNIELDRPLPHDLFTSMLGHLDAAVQRVEIRDMVDGTCYATVWVEPKNGEAVALDARPSDALALALRSRSPILVAEHVIDRAPVVDLGPCAPTRSRRPSTGANGRAASQPEALAAGGAAGSESEELGALGDEVFGKWKM